jgi:transposase InsO family protein
MRLPALSTVSSILRKEGLVAPSRWRRDPDLRGPAGAYRAGTSPNEQWTVDFKGQFRLGDRSMCFPLTVQDDATRFVLCVDGCVVPSTEAVLGSFERIFRRFGVPERIHSDNGAPFAGTGVGRRSRVTVEWMRQGIEVCRSRVGHPEDNPRHERMHRTLKAQTARPPSQSPKTWSRTTRTEGDAAAVGWEVFRDGQSVTHVPGTECHPCDRTYRARRHPRQARRVA